MPQFPSVGDSPGRHLSIPLSALRVDHQYYQRTDLGEPHLKKMAMSWSWVSCGALIVSERADNTYWILDGQRRWEAAKKRGDVNRLPCMVYRFNSVVEEAYKFIEINKERLSVKLHDRHNAKLTLDDATALRVMCFAQRANRELSKKKNGGTISCVFRLESAIKSDEMALSRVWDIISALSTGRALDEEILMAFHYLESYAAPGHSLGNRLWVKRMLTFGHDRVMEAVQTHATAREHNSGKLYAQGLMELVNLNMKKYRFELSPLELNAKGKMERVHQPNNKAADWYPDLLQKITDANQKRIEQAGIRRPTLAA